MEKQIYANYDEEGIFVYQAFSRDIVDAALEKGTFGEGFKMDRMTWIKPSFGWMLYRSGYGMKKNQEAILKIKLSHKGFLEILRSAAPSTYTDRIFNDQREWRDMLKKCLVRYQWDPDRDLRLEKMHRRRAIQLGLRGAIVEKYVNEWIIRLEEVTDLAHKVRDSTKTKRTLRTQGFPPVPEETVYNLDSPELEKQLQIYKGAIESLDH